MAFRELVLKAIKKLINKPHKTKPTPKHLKDSVWEGIVCPWRSSEANNKPYLTEARNTSVFFTHFLVKMNLICSPLNNLHSL